MQIGYLLREGFSGFRRAKLSMFAAVFTIVVSLLLLSFISILLLNAHTMLEALREKVEMEAFLNEQVSVDDVNRIRTEVLHMEGVREVRFISKEDAAAIFKEEFGEDIHKVLNFNPLPASFKIFLKDGYKTSVRAEEVYARLRALKGIDDVIYRKQLLEMLDQRAMTFLWITFAVGGIITLFSVVLVANTIRLAIYAKRKIIQTMKLIGATRWFIRAPFLLEGFIQGMLGGMTAAAIVYALFHYLERWVTLAMSDIVRVPVSYYLVIVGIGCLLGLVGSMISVRRFISESMAN